MLTDSSKTKIFIVGLILLLAFFLRSYQLSNNPPSLNWDEVSIGYNAYSILKTGKDEWGKTFPLIFRAYGDYKLPLYIYLSAPFVYLFGLSAVSVRLLSVISGTVAVYFTYLLSKEIIKLGDNNGSKIFDDNKKDLVAIISALLVAIEPWSLFLSRPALEANLALSLFIVGFYFFLKSIQNLKYLFPAIIFLGLTLWTYNSYRIFTPLFVLYLLFVFRNKLLGSVIRNKKYLLIGIFLNILFLAPMLYQFAKGVGGIRYSKVAIVDSGAVGQIINLRDKYNLSPFLEKIVFNRPTYFVYHFMKNIFSQFSYNFLFSQGGSNYQFNVPGYGLLYKIDLIFILFGLFYLIKKRSKKSAILIGWLLIGVIPSAITREAPQTLRSITMLPAPMIISAYGLILVFSHLEKLYLKTKYTGWMLVLGAFIILYSLVLSKQTLNYLQIYFNIYPHDYSWSWQYGYKEAVNYVKDNYDKYDKIIITKKYGEPHEFFLYYLSWSPSRYQQDKNLIRFEQSDWYWVDRFDKFYFVNDWEVPTEEWQPFVLESKKENVDCQNNRCLLITSPGNVPKTWNKLDTIRFLDGNTAFEIYGN